MIILLKIILGLFSVANGAAFRFVWNDFRKSKATEGFDELSVWEKLRFNLIFTFIATSLISLFVFLMYFIIVPITLG